MSKATQPEKPKVVTLPPNLVHVQQQQQVSLPPIEQIAGAQNVSQQMSQANAEMNARIEANKIPNNLGI